MKLHEQRDQLRECIKRASEEMNNFLGYLESDKFSKGEDWIRTWEVKEFFRRMRNNLEAIEM